VNASNSPAAVVIGAGPYGLAVAAHLLDRGVSVRVFGEPMDAWRHNMPEGMFLKSEPSASSLSAPQPGYRLEDYCRTIGVPPLREDQAVPIDLFVRYGRWFQEQLVPIEQQRVERVTPASNGFEIALGSGEVFTTRSVVMAAGHVQFTHVPPELRALAGGEPLPTAAVSHSSQHDDLSKFAGTDVAVVGRGQSALESAALLHESGAGVHLLVRASRVLWAGPPNLERTWRDKVLKPQSGLGPGWSHYGSERGAGLIRHLPAPTRLAIFRAVLGPAGAWWLHDRVEDVVEIRTSQSVAAASTEGDKVVLELAAPHGARQRLVVDHVLACTGYRVDVDSIEFLDQNLRARVDRVPASGFPSLNASFESSVPGLFFAGLSSAATFGPLMRFVCGTDFAAPRLARGVAAR
jgi:cation diffusion facilitator CzcD-associated flavoprotein CzcO